LNAPQATFASKVTKEDDGSFVVERETDGGMSALKSDVSNNLLPIKISDCISCHNFNRKEPKQSNSYHQMDQQ
jgi:hypothetical protein